MILKSIPVTLFMALTANLTLAQDWFSEYERNTPREGYIIGIAGDTIPGHIQYDYPVAMQKRVTFFRTLNQQNPNIYGPGDIRGYGVEDKRWISVQVIMDTYEGPFQFNRFGLVESMPGPIALVRIFEEQDKRRKKLNSEEAEIIYRNIPDKREPGSFDNVYIKKNEEPAVAVFTREFKKSFPQPILNYTADHGELKKKIDTRAWGWRDLDKIVNEYNRWFISRF